MDELILRRGTPADAGAVADLWHRGWQDGHAGLVPEELAEARTPESFRERASRRVGEMTLAIVRGSIAGFVLVAGDELEQLYVSEVFRGQGVADALTREAERQLRESGHTRAWLAVVPGNRRARAFYERSGWRDEGAFDYMAPTDDGRIPVPSRRYTKTL